MAISILNLKNHHSEPGMADVITETLGSIARILGECSRAIWEGCSIIICAILKLFDHIYSWAQNLVHTMANKFREGWRMFVAELDVSEIPPNIIPQEKLRGAKKISLGILTDKQCKPQKIDKAWAHKETDPAAREFFGKEEVVELEL